MKFFSEEFIGQHFQEVGLNDGNPQPGDLFLFQFQIPVPVPSLAHVGVYCGQGEIIQYEGERKQIWPITGVLHWGENWAELVGSVRGRGSPGVGLQFEEMLSLICTGPAISTGTISTRPVSLPDMIFTEDSNSILQRLQGYMRGVVYKEGLRAMKHSRNLLRVLRKRGGVDPKVLERRVREAMNSIPPPYHLLKNNCVHFALKLLGMDLVSSSPLAAQIQSQPQVC